MTTHNVFSLHINVDGEAFYEDTSGEVARILTEAAKKVQMAERFGRIKDINGNRVGYWTYGTEEGN